MNATTGAEHGLSGLLGRALRAVQYVPGPPETNKIKYVVDSSGQRRAHIRDQNFENDIVVDKQWPKSYVERCDFKGATLKNVNFGSGTVRICDFRGATLTSVSFVGTDLECSDFRGVDFSGVDLRRADLRKVLGLTVKQIFQATTDAETKLPAYLARELDLRRADRSNVVDLRPAAPTRDPANRSLGLG